MDVGKLGPGRHVLQMPNLGSVPPGLYTIRLSLPDRSVTSRITLLR